MGRLQTRLVAGIEAAPRRTVLALAFWKWIPGPIFPDIWKHGVDIVFPIGSNTWSLALYFGNIPDKEYFR